MIEDHAKLNNRELAALLLAGVGIALVSSMISPSLKVNLQKDLVNAVKIFDLSQSYQQPTEVIVFVWDAQKNFLDEIYVAFNQVAILPEGDMAAAGSAVNNFLFYSESLAKDYSYTAYVKKDYAMELVSALDQRQGRPFFAEAMEGRVAGARTENNGCQKRDSQINSGLRSSDYQAPDLSLVKNKIISVYEKFSY